MTKAGFLESQTVRRHLPPEEKEELTTSINAILFSGGTTALPPTFKRYILPGAPGPLEFKAADQMFTRHRQFDHLTLNSPELKAYFRRPQRDVM